MALSAGLQFGFGGNNASVSFYGTTWGLFVVVRRGDYLLLYHNDILLNTFLLGSITTYGGTVSIMSNQTGQIEDVRIYNSAISTDALAYYHRNMVNDNGNAFLPIEE